MTEGCALVEQSFDVDPGGWLDFFPAPLIPQLGSRYRQRTRISLQPGAELFFLDILTPGRLIRGGWSLRLVARDSVALRRGVDELRARLGRILPELQHRIRS